MCIHGMGNNKKNGIKVGGNVKGVKKLMVSNRAEGDGT